MGNIFNEDFRDFIHELNSAEVRYVLVGGFSVILHGHSRTTGDMDIWVERTSENYRKLKIAFAKFGMPVFDMNEANFLDHPSWDVFTYGIPPSAIDIMVNLKGLNFEDCYKEAVDFLEDELRIKTINLQHLIKAKEASNRPKDVDDIQNLKGKSPK